MSSLLIRGDYLETLTLLATEESFMKEHVETSIVFKGTSLEIQNDLFESVPTLLVKQFLSLIHI